MPNDSERAPRTVERVLYLCRWAELEHLTETLRQELVKACNNTWHKDRWTSNGATVPHDVDIVLTGTHYEFRTPNLALLDPYLDGLEAKISDPGYTIRQSPLVVAAIQKLIDGGRRATVKAASDSVIPIGSSDVTVFLKGMRQHAEFTAKAFETTPPTIFVVPWNGNTLFMFRCGTEEEVLKRFEGVVLKKSVPAPRSVLVKMAALRMKKLCDGLESHNQSVRQNRALYESDPTKWAHYANSVELPSLKLQTVKACQELADNPPQMSWGGGAWHSGLKELKELLAKEGLDDSVIADGWDIQMVRDIMTR